MDYEQKYKKAFGWMRSIYPTMQGAEKEDAEHYFPELRESEDEKIRKAIICGMNALKEQHKETFASIPINDCIAWLEKQGEQKPIDYNEELKKCRENPLYFFDKYVKTKEQKPAWSEEDLNKLANYLHNNGHIIFSDAKQKAYEISLLLRKQNSWKPNKEQMDTLKYACGGNYVDLGILESLYNDLKKL